MRNTKHRHDMLGLVEVFEKGPWAKRRLSLWDPSSEQGSSHVVGMLQCHTIDLRPTHAHADIPRIFRKHRELPQTATSIASEYRAYKQLLTSGLESATRSGQSVAAATGLMLSFCKRQDPVGPLNLNLWGISGQTPVARPPLPKLQHLSAKPSQ